MGLALSDDSRLHPALARDFQAAALGHLLVVSGDTGPHVSPPDRRRDPLAIMGRSPGSGPAERGQRETLVRGTIGISAPFTITRTGPPPIARQSFVVGADPPAGFTESVPLAHKLPTNLALAGIVSTDRVSAAVTFRVSNLLSTRIRTFSGQYATPTDFRQLALSRCNT